MADLLPVGAYVRVTPQPWRTLDGATKPADPPYVARVNGYNTFCTKYRLGERVPGGGGGKWRFMKNGRRWEFPSVVKEITEEEALRVDA